MDSGWHVLLDLGEEGRNGGLLSNILTLYFPVANRRFCLPHNSPPKKCVILNSSFLIIILKSQDKKRMNEGSFSLLTNYFISAWTKKMCTKSSFWRRGGRSKMLGYFCKVVLRPGWLIQWMLDSRDCYPWLCLFVFYEIPIESTTPSGKYNFVEVR